MNKVISMIALIVCSLGATGIYAQTMNINMEGWQKATFCAQAKIAFGLVYYQLCNTLGNQGYSLEKMRTIVNNARNKYGKCIEQYYDGTITVSALKQTTDIYCEKGDVYVGFAKQNSLKAYKKAFEAEAKAIEKEWEREAAEEAKALQKTEQAKIQAAMKNYSVGEPFIDERDKQKYKIVRIGEQVWFAENLNYAAEDSKCYDNEPANCQKYGRLYDWNTAMRACPNGWHLPSDEEWDVLTAAVGDKETTGKFLKAKNGWNNNNNGADVIGFSALPGGHGYSDGSFYDVGDRGYWWSASEDGANDAYSRNMIYYNERGSYSKSINLFSVRCLKD